VEEKNMPMFTGFKKGFDLIIHTLRLFKDHPKKSYISLRRYVPCMPKQVPGCYLERGWVIANHILVSFHVAFISSVLCLPLDIIDKGATLEFIFFSPDTLISALFLWFVGHTGIAIHEMGHYLKAVKLDALSVKLLPEAKANMAKSLPERIFWYFKMFCLIPYGKFPGVLKKGLTYYPDAPFNLAVSAAGPAASKKLSIIFLPLAVILSFLGLSADLPLAVYIGRLFLGLGAVSGLDFLIADPGKYRQFKERESLAKIRAKEIKVKAKPTAWIEQVVSVKTRMLKTRMQTVVRKDGVAIWTPWQHRNSGMGGRHTEKEYPESNISMQETMFVILSAENYEDAQEMTVSLQNRLKEIIENAEGCRVMGIGLEGGLAPYITKEAEDIVPEQRLWRMAKQAIIECGYVPGVDVALAIDPATSELQNAYREEFEQPDAIGMYLFWRDKEKLVMSRDQIYELYRKTIEENDVPIVTIEDGFAEDDDEGWALITRELGDKLFIIGDDSVTTKDSSIEYAADNNLNNTFLCKANQIGTLSETLLAILVGLGKSLEILVSHRSKSPNDDMEAQIALSASTMGIKAGGGANTERLFKYGAIMKIMAEAVKEAQTKAQETSEEDKLLEQDAGNLINRLVITNVSGWEEATNAGIPTVGVRTCFGIKDSQRFKNFFIFTGSTPLGTSAGTDEAIHLVDSVIDKSQITKDEYLSLFKQTPDGSYRFNKEVTKDEIDEYQDPYLSELYRRSKRYNGKGCLNAVDHVNKIFAKTFEGQRITDIISLVNTDRRLLALERQLAQERGQLKPESTIKEQINVMQRKGNLGMNAILSQSLALARLAAHMQGKELWEILRQCLTETMAKTIAANGGLEILPEDVRRKLTVKDDQPLWATLREQLSFEELKQGLQAVNNNRPKNTKLYELLREQLPVYKVDKDTEVKYNEPYLVKDVSQS
jgi:enolase